MKMKQPVRVQMQMDSQWMQISVIFMGFCVFIKAVYYLGLINLKDLDGYQLFTQLILPGLVAAAYLILLKGLNLNAPILLGGLSGLYALDYFLVLQKGEVVSAVLMALNVVVFLATVLGYIPDIRPVILIGAISAAYRVIVVDLFGYILPFSDWKFVSYLPSLSNMFAVLAVGSMAPALQLIQRKQASPESSNISE